MWIHIVPIGMCETKYFTTTHQTAFEMPLEQSAVEMLIDTYLDIHTNITEAETNYICNSARTTSNRRSSVLRTYLCNTTSA